MYFKRITLWISIKKGLEAAKRDVGRPVRSLFQLLRRDRTRIRVRAKGESEGAIRIPSGLLMCAAVWMGGVISRGQTYWRRNRTGFGDTSPAFASKLKRLRDTVVDEKMCHQDSSSRKDTLLAGREAVSREPPAFSNFRVCLSHDSCLARSHALPGQPTTMNE